MLGYEHPRAFDVFLDCGDLSVCDTGKRLELKYGNANDVYGVDLAFSSRITSRISFSNVSKAPR